MQSMAWGFAEMRLAGSGTMPLAMVPTAVRCADLRENAGFIVIS
jgi:hypothetical protein